MLENSRAIFAARGRNSFTLSSITGKAYLPFGKGGKQGVGGGNCAEFLAINIKPTLRAK